MLLKLPTVMRETALGRSTIYAAIKAGEFPAPLRIGKRAVAWRSENLDAWRNTRRPSGGATPVKSAI